MRQCAKCGSTEIIDITGADGQNKSVCMKCVNSRALHAAESVVAADVAALASDWQAVGNDLQQVTQDLHAHLNELSRALAVPRPKSRSGIRRMKREMAAVEEREKETPLQRHQAVERTKAELAAAMRELQESDE